MSYGAITYLFEFSPMFGPSWYSVPEEIEINVEPGGHLNVLWTLFNDWLLYNVLN